jgi:two-component system LytT family response regulator
MNCIIIDDDLEFSEFLKRQLTDVLNLQVVGQASSVQEGIRLLNEIQPDLLFLDVELPDGKGFDVLEGFQNLNFHLIVTSAHEKYALNAFKVAAVDYLLKPFSLAALNAALQRVQERSKELSATSIQAFMKNQSQLQVDTKMLGISTMSDIHFVPLGEVAFCRADGNYTEFYFLDNRIPIISSKPIRYYEELLEECHFFRVHKSFLANLSNVRIFKRQECVLRMANGTQIAVSRIRREALLRKLEKL